MTTLFDERLSHGDFGSQLLYVPDLQEWVKSKRLHLRTTPPLDGYEFVQVESLLCAIERHSGDLTNEQAVEIVMNDPGLKNDPIIQKYPDDIIPANCRWLIGAESHRKWRVLITDAIAAKELELLDFGSKLPMDATPASVVSATSLSEQPQLDRPWWQSKYDIHDMAWNIGASLKEKGDRPSNNRIAQGIEKRIDDIERGKGSSKRSPDSETLRKFLNGWRWSPEETGRALGPPFSSNWANV